VGCTDAVKRQNKFVSENTLERKNPSAEPVQILAMEEGRPPLHLPHPNKLSLTSFWFLFIFSVVSRSLDLKFTVTPRRVTRASSHHFQASTTFLSIDVTYCSVCMPHATMVRMGCACQRSLWFLLVDSMVLYSCSSDSLAVELLYQISLTLLLFVSQSMVGTYYLFIQLSLSFHSSFCS
jgi:hypothetical protein